MEPEITMTDEEREALLKEDPTEQVAGRKTSLSERRKRAEYMRAYREAKREEAGDTQQRREEHEKFIKESYGLFEDENQRLYDSLEGLLSSARRFVQILQATKLDVPDVLPLDTLRSFGMRVYQSWRLRSFARIIYTGSDFRFNCGCIGEWPNNPNEPQLPTWPQGSDDVLDLTKLPELWGETELQESLSELRAEAEVDMKLHPPIKRNIIGWRSNPPGNGNVAPIVSYHETDPAQELFAYGKGFRWTTLPGVKYPILVLVEPLVQNSARLPQESLREFADGDYAAAVEAIKQEKS